jgi:DNA adenine methylase
MSYIFLIIATVLLLTAFAFLYLMHRIAKSKNLNHNSYTKMIPAPFKRYNGGKSGSGVYQTIINLLPPCSTFVSAFVGNGGIERRIKLPANSYFFDTNKEVVAAWKKILPVTWNKSTGIINKIQVKCEDGLTAIGNFKNEDKSTLIFCDPPYLFDTRASQQKLYGNQEWSYEDHVLFLSMIKHCSCNVAITHPPHILYENMLHNWNVFDYEYRTSDKGKKMWDRVWYNYPTPTILQDYTYLGNNYRLRELIKKKTRRHMAKLKRLPDAERNAILSAVISEYGNSSIINMLNNGSKNKQV